MNCSDCHFSCLQCNGNEQTMCLSCSSDRDLSPNNKCICKPVKYEIYQEHTCGSCSAQCTTCENHSSFCKGCSFSGDILSKDGYCLCGQPQFMNRIRHSDGSCKEKMEFSCEIFTEIDVVTNENLVIAKFSQNLSENLPSDKIRNFLIFSVQSSSQVLSTQRLLSSEQIYVIFDRIESDQIVFRVKSQSSFSSMTIYAQIKNSEFIISSNGDTLPLSIVNSSLSLLLAEQYNIDGSQFGLFKVSNSFGTINSIFSLFQISQYLYIYPVLLPIYQVIYLVQMFPVQLPPNLYNYCYFFSSMSLEISQKYGTLNRIQPNKVYGNTIDTLSQYTSVPKNFHVLGFTSNFFSNALEVIVLIVTLYLILSVLYHLHTNPWMTRYQFKIKIAFSVVHNLLSFYVEGTFFILVISFWLNLIYIDFQNPINVFGFFFGAATIIALYYFFYYQMCLLELSSKILANRHMSNMLVICHWYQRFFKFFRYFKKWLILSLFVIFNFNPILQMSLIIAVLIATMLISIRVRPFIYTIDNLTLIGSDTCQVLLGVSLLFIASLHKKMFEDAEVISNKDFTNYYILGWFAVCFLFSLTVLHITCLILSLTRIIRFISANNSNQIESRYGIYAFQKESNSICENEPAKNKLVIEQADQAYLENLKKQEIEGAINSHKKKFFQAMVLNQGNKIKNDYIRENPSIDPNRIVKKRVSSNASQNSEKQGNSHSQNIIELVDLKLNSANQQPQKESKNNNNNEIVTTSPTDEGNNISTFDIEGLLIENPFLGAESDRGKRQTSEQNNNSQNLRRTSKENSHNKNRSSQEALLKDQYEDQHANQSLDQKQNEEQLEDICQGVFSNSQILLNRKYDDSGLEEDANAIANLDINEFKPLKDQNLLVQNALLRSLEEGFGQNYVAAIMPQAEEPPQKSNSPTDSLNAYLDKCKQDPPKLEAQKVQEQQESENNNNINISPRKKIIGSNLEAIPENYLFEDSYASEVEFPKKTRNTNGH